MSALVYIHCPHCSAKIREPFNRHSGPIAFLHRPRANTLPCRLIIWPDPDGNTHRAWKVSRDQSLEDVLSMAVKQWVIEQARKAAA